MAKTISDKNTKTEIIEAYNEVLAQLKEQKMLNQQALKKEAETREVVKEASENTIGDIVNHLAGLKVQIVQTIDDLEEKMIAEYRRFSGLQQAVTAQTKMLDDLYGIQAEADRLTALVLVQKEKRRHLKRKWSRQRFPLTMTCSKNASNGRRSRKNSSLRKRKKTR